MIASDIHGGLELLQPLGRYLRRHERLLGDGWQVGVRRPRTLARLLTLTLRCRCPACTSVGLFCISYIRDPNRTTALTYCPACGYVEN